MIQIYVIICTNILQILKKYKVVAGATVRGDGSIGLIIDVKTILEAH